MFEWNETTSFVIATITVMFAIIVAIVASKKFRENNK